MSVYVFLLSVLNVFAGIAEIMSEHLRPAQLMDGLTSSSREFALAKIGMQAKFDRVSYSPTDAKKALCSVELSCLEETAHEAVRAPWDLVLCVDDSMSMETRIRSVSICIEFILRSFVNGPGRIGLIKFADKSQVLFPLLAITESNVEDLVLKVWHGLHANGCTNLEAGLNDAFDMLVPSSSNAACPISTTRGIVLLSDGVATVGECNSKRLNSAIQSHPGFAGSMFSVLAIGSGCDTSLLFALCSEACGGSMWEITATANPSEELGAMMGMGVFQRLVQPSIIIKNSTRSAPVDICGLRSKRNVCEGTLSYQLGNMSVGEKRTMLFEIDLCDLPLGEPSVTVTLTTAHAMHTGSFQLVLEETVGSTTAGQSSPQCPGITLQTTSIRAINLLCDSRWREEEADSEEFCAKLRRVHTDLITLADLFQGNSNYERDVKRARKVLQRIAWALEMSEDDESLCRLQRTGMTELLHQRSTTYQSSQDASQRLRSTETIISGLENETTEEQNLVVPSLVRSLSEHASQYMASYETENDEPALPLNGGEGDAIDRLKNCDYSHFESTKKKFSVHLDQQVKNVSDSQGSSKRRK